MSEAAINAALHARMLAISRACGERVMVTGPRFTELLAEETWRAMWQLRGVPMSVALRIITGCKR